MFYNNLLPSIYGGDLARTARLYAAGFGGSALVSSAFVDRVLGLAALVSMGVIALLFAPAGFENRLALGVFGLSMLALLPMAGHRLCYPGGQSCWMPVSAAAGRACMRSCPVSRATAVPLDLC